MFNPSSYKSSFIGQNILIIGDLMLDRYFDGRADRMSPEAPVPILDHQSTRNCLGGAANVALNIKSLGGNPMLCGYIGGDEAAEEVRALLNFKGIAADMVLTSLERRTTLKTRVMAGGRHLLRIDSEDRFDLTNQEEKILLDKIEFCLSNNNVDAIIFQDYNKGLLTNKVITQVISWGMKQNIFISVDPKKKRFTDYQGVSLFKPNLKEVQEAIYPQATHRKDNLLAAQKVLQEKIKHQYTMITLSEFGLFLGDKDQATIYPTEIREVKDVCGAGDAVISIATMALVAKLDLATVARLSNWAGGQVCGISGVAPVSID